MLNKIIFCIYLLYDITLNIIYFDNIQQNPMKTVKKFFGEFDMFAAPPLLRANQQDKTSSLCSGVISLLLALFFTYVFINNVVLVLSYQKIQSVQTQSRLGFNETKANDVFFGVRVGYLPVQIADKYFTVGFYIVQEDGTNTTYLMQQCTPDQWKKLGDNYQVEYGKFKLHDFYCTKPEYKINLKKVYYAPNSQFAVVFVRPCTLNDSSTCESPAAQQTFIQNLNNIQGAIFISVYFIDEAINPNSKQATQFFTNTDVEVAFTTKRGIISTIQLGSYRVQTDMSVFPVEQIAVEQGNFVDSFRETSIQIKSSQDNFALIYITMNRKHILVERKVGKLDELLSYVGGLFAIIIGFLAIFISSFNKYRYELMVAQGIFHQDQDGNAIKEHQFSFFRYIKYTIFDWVSVLFCIQIKWQDCLIIQSTRDQANKQMDVTRLFRKIQALQISINYLMKERKQKDCLSLLKPQSLPQIIRNRLVLQYYQIVIAGKSSLNFQQYNISHQILKFGMTLLKNQQFQNANRLQNFNSTQHDILSQENQININNLIDKDYLLDAIKLKFSDIVREAQQLKLEQQHQQVQKQLSQSYFQLNPQIRMQLQNKIPIKILYRLAKCYSEQKKSQEDTRNTVKNKKKVLLNIIQPSKIHITPSNQSNTKSYNEN